MYALSQWPTSFGPQAPVPWERCGVLQLADGAVNEARVADTAAALGYPRAYAEYVTREAAGALAGCAVTVGGWWFPGAGWVQPREIVQRQLFDARPRLRLEREVTTLECVEKQWRVRDGPGAIVAEAPVVVLAGAGDAARLVDLGTDSLRNVRGQQSYLASPPFERHAS
jgi:tRNA 5-methylaminomethyl-2-thiouridine biosynthesis bifunctional protein